MCIRDSHMHEEVMHNRIDSQIVGYRSQYDVTVFECITDPVSYTHLDVYKRQCVT